MLEPRRTCADIDACAYGSWHGLCGLCKRIMRLSWVRSIVGALGRRHENI